MFSESIIKKSWLLLFALNIIVPTLYRSYDLSASASRYSELTRRVTQFGSFSFLIILVGVAVLLLYAAFEYGLYYCAYVRGGTRFLGFVILLEVFGALLSDLDFVHLRSDSIVQASSIDAILLLVSSCYLLSSLLLYNLNREKQNKPFLDWKNGGIVLFCLLIYIVVKSLFIFGMQIDIANKAIKENVEIKQLN